MILTMMIAIVTYLVIIMLNHPATQTTGHVFHITDSNNDDDYDNDDSHSYLVIIML